MPIDVVVHKSPAFKKCSLDFVETVLLKMKKILFRPGQLLVEERSTTPASMFFLLWGCAEVCCTQGAGRLVTEGQCFGEAMALGISTEWRSNVRAKTACMVCELSKEHIWETLQGFAEELAIFEKVVERHTKARQEGASQHSGWSVMRRCASLRGCSEDFLRDLEDCLDRRIYFPGEHLFQEGDDDCSLYVLDLGCIHLEINERLIRIEDVPTVRTKLSYGDDIVVMQNKMPHHGKKFSSDISSTHSSVDDVGSNSSEPASPKRAPSNMSPSASGFFGSVRDDDNDSLTGENDDELPHAVMFGEEALLGISPRRTTTARARTSCDVRILYRPAFLSILEKHPNDRNLVEDLLDISHDVAFPRLSAKDHQYFSDSACSQKFYDFLSLHVEERIFGLGEQITLDTFHKHLHHGVPDGNVSLCRINRGRVQAIEMGRAGSEREKDKYPGGHNGELGPGALVGGDHFWGGDSIRALEVCFVSVLHRGVIARALEELPADRDILVPSIANRQTTKQPRMQKSEKVARILRERSIFANASQYFIDEIITCGITRVFMPGDRIIEQGTDGTSMFILWLGSASVVTEQIDEYDGHTVKTLTNVGMLAYGSVFGELVMLGVQSRRTASIIAATVCCTWEVEHKNCLAILDRHPIERANFLKLVEEHLDRLAAPRIIYHPLFSGFHQQFRTLIGVNCVRKLSFPGETIVREGSCGDRLYIMNLGTAAIEIHHQHVMQVAGGSHFGFSVMTGVQEKYPTTVVAETMCQVLIVNRNTYQHALHKYPEMREVHKQLDADEKFRVQRQRAIFARMVKRRRGMRCIIEALRGSGLSLEGDEQHPSKTLVEMCFAAWRNTLLRKKEYEREEEEQRASNARRIEQWLERRKVQMAHVKPRIDMKRLIDYNLTQRGPLKLAKKPVAGAIRLPTTQSVDPLENSDSPYMSPSPAWRRGAMTARQSCARRLPPIIMAATSPCPDEAPKALSWRGATSEPVKGSMVHKEDAHSDDGGQGNHRDRCLPDGPDLEVTLEPGKDIQNGLSRDTVDDDDPLIDQSCTSIALKMDHDMCLAMGSLPKSIMHPCDL